MNRVLEVESIAELDLVARGLPVFYSESEYFDPTYAEPAFAVGPVEDLCVLSPNFILVADTKKAVNAYKKAGYRVESVDASVSAVAQSFGLTRQSMAISQLKKAYEQMQVAHRIALLGESRDTIEYALADYEDVSGFIIQEAFLTCKLSRCLKLAEQTPATNVVGVAALLLSGHTMAFMIHGSSLSDVIAAGFNSFYANKIRDFSTNYLRRVDYHKSTQLLSSVLPRIKSGEDPVHLLRRVVLQTLTRVH